MEPRAIKLGFLPANRGFFDQQLAREMRARILVVAADLGVELVCPTETQTSGGCVGNRSEARICAELFDREAVDGVVVSAVNFGDEQAVAETLRPLRPGLPVLLHGCPEDGPLSRTGKRRDAFCGLLSIAEALRQIGRSYSLPQHPLCAPGSPGFADELDRFHSVCRVVRGIRGARYGQVGIRPDAFWTCRYDERALQKLGPTVVTIDLSEIIARVAALPDESVRDTAEQMAAGCATGRTPPAAMLKLAKLERVLSDWAAAEDLDGLAIQCWTSIEQNLGICPCFVMSRLGDLGIPCACEADVPGLLSMHALLLAGAPAAALADWNNLHHADPDLVNLWHCGVYPASMAKGRPELDRHSILGPSGAVEVEKTHGVVNLEVREGDATLFRVAGENGAWRALVVGGCFESDGSSTSGSFGWCRVPGLLNFYRDVLLRQYPHHVAFSHGRQGAVLSEAFGTYLGFQIDTGGFENRAGSC